MEPNTPTLNAKYRDRLPQLSAARFVTDGGIETTLIYKDGLELPSFASFVLFKDDKGTQALRKYFASYAELSRAHQVGVILETATWRANPDWGHPLGYSDAELADVNGRAVRMLHEIRQEFETPENPIVISGCIGPRGDGYQPDKRMSAEDAESYHQPQIEALARNGADLISALTMNYVEEAIGVVWAARTAGMPVVISFTVETNGRLPTGETLEEAINSVDEATDSAVSYFMINCAHPIHFPEPKPSDAWANRIRGIRVNASRQSHAELDKATALDDGNPEELAVQCAKLASSWPNLRIAGGCCGTDERHIEAIAKSFLSKKSPTAVGDAAGN